MRQRVSTVLFTLLLLVPPGLMLVYTSRAQARRAATCAAVASNAKSVDAILDYFQAAVLKGDSGNATQLAKDHAFFDGIPRPQGCH